MQPNDPRQLLYMNALLGSTSQIGSIAESASQLRDNLLADDIRTKNRQLEAALYEKKLKAEAAEASASRRFNAREGQLDRQAYGYRGGGTAPTQVSPYAGLDAPTARKAREQAMTSVNADDAVVKLENLGPDQNSSGVTQFFVNVLKDATFSNLAKALAAASYDADEKAARAAVDASVESFKRALAGANLTVNEVGLSANWDPSQAQNDADKIARLIAMQDSIDRNRSVLGLPPIPRTSQTAKAAITEAPQPNLPTVVRGGVTYVKENGRWRRK